MSKKNNDFLGLEENNLDILEEIKQKKNWKYRNASIYLTQKTYSKMIYYAKASFGEISGFGKVVIRGNKINVVDLRIFPQKCTSGHTLIDGKDLSRFIVSLAKRNENPADWKLWWHSHNDFGTFFSGEDEGTINELSQDSLLISICSNKNGEFSGRVDEKGQIEDAPVYYSLLRKFKYQCKKDVKKMVRKESIRLRFVKNEDLYENPEEDLNNEFKFDETAGFYPSF